MKKIAFFILILGTLFLFPSWTKAQSVSVNALIPSKVSTQYSSATINVNELLADLSQRALVTVRLRDSDNKPLDNIPIVISSNRGEIDWIRATSASGEIIDLVENKSVAKTDENGFAFFRVSSKIPGEAHLAVVADTLVELDSVKIKFLPLPFPTNVTVTVEVPSFLSPENKITIFKPSGYDFDRDKLVNLGVEIIIPFWLIITILGFLAMGPLLFFIIFFLILRVRKYEKINKACLEKEVALIEKQGEVLKKEQSDIEKEEKILEEMAGENKNNHNGQGNPPDIN